jgi:hypothetical protein
MGVWDAVVGGATDYALQKDNQRYNSQEAERQSERNFANNMAMQNSAQSFNESMYHQQWGDSQRENRWQWGETKKENRWAWEAKKAETRYWADNGHKHEVDALRKAGLNPILAATGGFRGSAVPALTHQANQSSRAPASAASGVGGTSSSSAHSTKLEISRNIAALKLLESQKNSIDAGTAKTLLEGQSQQITNSAKEINLREQKIKTDWKSGPRGGVWRNVLVPAKDFLNTFNPFSNAKQTSNGK